MYRMLKNIVDSVHLYHPIFEDPLGEFTGENMYHIWRMLCIQQDVYFLDAVGGHNGVCSIFLRVDRPKNEIHKPRALSSVTVFYRKYVFIYY